MGGDRGTSEQWVHRLRRGEAEAVREVRRRVGRIIRYRRLRMPPQERDDLEQQIVTEVWQGVNRSSFDLTLGFWGFVEVVSARRCLDWLRGRRDPYQVLDPGIRDGRADPLERSLREERSKWVGQILSSLEPACRELIVMRFRDDLPYRRIAERLGKGEGAVRVQMYRCIRRARDLVERLPRERRSQDEEGRG